MNIWTAPVYLQKQMYAISLLELNTRYEEHEKHYYRLRTFCVMGFAGNGAEKNSICPAAQ